MAVPDLQLSMKGSVSYPRCLTPPIRALLIDISGTLLIGSSPIPGAAQALATLRTARIPFRFCSNTSKESTDAMHERMRAAGLDARRDELWTSIGALRAVLKALAVTKPYMLLSTSALEECTHGQGTEDDDALSPIPHDAVVVGLAPPLLDYAHLNTAFRILAGEHRPRDARKPPSTSESSTQSPSVSQPQRQRPPLIALHKARYIEASDHARALGPGPFVNTLEDAAQTSAIVVGKPTRAFFEAVLRDMDHDLGADASQRCDDDADGRGRRWEGVAVIGDDVLADLGQGAIELGLWRVLVKTGKYRPGDEARSDAVPPNQVCSSFAEFVELLIEQRKALS